MEKVLTTVAKTFVILEEATISDALPLETAYPALPVVFYLSEFHGNV